MGNYLRMLYVRLITRSDGFTTHDFREWWFLVERNCKVCCSIFDSNAFQFRLYDSLVESLFCFENVLRHYCWVFLGKSATILRISEQQRLADFPTFKFRTFNIPNCQTTFEFSALSLSSLKITGNLPSPILKISSRHSFSSSTFFNAHPRIYAKRKSYATTSPTYQQSVTKNCRSWKGKKMGDHRHRPHVHPRVLHIAFSKVEPHEACARAVLVYFCPDTLFPVSEGPLPSGSPFDIVASLFVLHIGVLSPFFRYACFCLVMPCSLLFASSSPLAVTFLNTVPKR